MTDKHAKNLIVVNARFLTQPTTGVQRFGIEICLHLATIFKNIVFVSPKNIIQEDIAKRLRVVRYGILSSHLWEQVELPIFLKKYGSPVLLNLCNTAPLLYNKSIVTIHDIAFQVNPKWFSSTFVRVYQFLIPRIARRSLKIITVSHFSKKSIIDYTGVPPEKVDVIYNGIADVFRTDQQGSKPEYSNYILAVSSIDPRKNLITLVRAFKQLNNNELTLVIVGAESKVFADAGLKNEMEGISSIKFSGYLSDQKLAAAYKEATMFVYPSLYEGFGIPPIEAMACGCPTIVSNTTALPEICGNASLYINPIDVEDLKEKINYLYQNASVQEDLKAKGYKQIKQYNWEVSANTMASLIKRYL